MAGGSRRWPLDEIARAGSRLADSGGGSAALLTFDSGMPLSAGWAEGPGAGQDDRIDPTSGLPRLSVLELRLQQVYDQCASSGSSPTLFMRSLSSTRR